MAEMTLGKARDNLSALVAELVDGRAKEHVIKRRGTPVVKMVPVTEAPVQVREFGMFANNPMVVDDGVFDSLDEEIAEEFGV